MKILSTVSMIALTAFMFSAPAQAFQLSELGTGDQTTSGGDATANTGDATHTTGGDVDDDNGNTGGDQNHHDRLVRQDNSALRAPGRVIYTDNSGGNGGNHCTGNVSCVPHDGDVATNTDVTASEATRTHAAGNFLQ